MKVIWNFFPWYPALCEWESKKIFSCEREWLWYKNSKRCFVFKNFFLPRKNIENVVCTLRSERNFLKRQKKSISYVFDVNGFLCKRKIFFLRKWKFYLKSYRLRLKIWFNTSRQLEVLCLIFETLLSLSDILSQGEIDLGLCNFFEIF